MAKRIELEYFSMIDQVVFACDDKLNILYNNYHERFYERIMKKVEDYVNIQLLRSKGIVRLDKFFVQTKDKEVRVQAEPSTMRNLLKMYDTFEFDSLDISKFDYYKSVNVIQILKSLEVYESKLKRNLIAKSTKQVKMEKRRNQLSNVQLVVDFF